MPRYRVTVEIRVRRVIFVDAPNAKHAEAVADGLTGKQVASRPNVPGGGPLDGAVRVLQVDEAVEQ